MTAKARLKVNVDLNRPAYQSSVWADQHDSYPPSNANDGNHDTKLIRGSCFATRVETNLGVALYVQGVNLTNRDRVGKHALLLNVWNFNVGL